MCMRGGMKHGKHNFNVDGKSVLYVGFIFSRPGVDMANLNGGWGYIRSAR